jgi:hypothetical protein
LVISGSVNRSASLVQISNITLSDDKSIILETKPIKYYERDILNSYAAVNQTLGMGDENGMNKIGLYIEYVSPKLNNSDSDDCSDGTLGGWLVC